MAAQLMVEIEGTLMVGGQCRALKMRTKYVFAAFSLFLCLPCNSIPLSLLCQWSERMARSWWASKKVSELELQTPLTVTPSVTIQVSLRLSIGCARRVL